MASPFPQLLRRSKFATHDGVITRVYASTPSSVHQHGDWGMKFPIHRSGNDKGGPRYITVNQMDTGTILGSDWRSAEKEARFVENWGRAGRWTHRDIEAERLRTSSAIAAGSPLPSRGRGGAHHLEKYAERDLHEEHATQTRRAQEAEQGVYLVPDVNRMSRREFEKYLDTIRAARSSAKANTEGETMVERASRGKTSASDADHYRATLAHTELMSPESTQINSVPHLTHGLAYSASTPSSSSAASSGLPGRLIGRTSDSSQSRSAYGYVNRRADDDNRPWAVSLGGLTANLSNEDRSTRDSGKRLEPVDYTRLQPTRGESTFQIRKAQITSPATVQYLQQRNHAARWSAHRGDRVSGAKQASPLDTFASDIILTESSSSSSASPGPGSKEWVARDSANAPRYTSEEDRLGGIGGAKSARTPGQTINMLGQMERQAQRDKERKTATDNKSAVQNLVSRLGHRR